MSSLPISHKAARVVFAALAVALIVGALVGFGINSQRERLQIARVVTGGNPDAAPLIMRRYGCVGCHAIPGAPGADGQVGGSLAGIRQRVYVGGVLNNTGDNLARWIVHPQSFSPHSAMPATGITEAE